MTTIMPAFDTFPKEGAIIGRILAGYPNLEFSLCHCVAAGASDFDAVFKAMFRTRGETQRIQIADALGRKQYEALRLGTHFAEAIGGMTYCLKIRNRFAHCQWYGDLSGVLAFVDLEDLADSKQPVNDLSSIPPSYLDVLTLEAQEAYFVFVDRCLTYLNLEGRKRAGKLSTHPFSMPKKGKRPPLCRL